MSIKNTFSSIYIRGGNNVDMCAWFSNLVFIMPIGEWATAIWAPHIELPKLQTEELMTLTLSLLGLGGMRSFEKSRGVARESMKK